MFLHFSNKVKYKNNNKSKIFTNFEEIEKEIINETNRIAGEGKVLNINNFII